MGRPAPRLHPRRDRPLWVAARVLLAVLGVTIGVLVAALTALLGDCGAFGGPCPSPPAVRNDVYGGLATGVALAVALPVLAWWPDRRGLAVAVAVALPLATVVAYLVGAPLIRG